MNDEIKQKIGEARKRKQKAETEKYDNAKKSIYTTIADDKVSKIEKEKRAFRRKQITMMAYAVTIIVAVSSVIVLSFLFAGAFLVDYNAILHPAPCKNLKPESSEYADVQSYLEKILAESEEGKPALNFQWSSASDEAVKKYGNEILGLATIEDVRVLSVQANRHDGSYLVLCEFSSNARLLVVLSREGKAYQLVSVDLVG